MSEKGVVRVKVWGPWACFTRPEMKVERVSYPVMTPSAARGVLEAILWKPEFRWIIRSISVLKEIRFQPIRRNEIQKVVSTAAVKRWMKDPSRYEPFYADIAGRVKGAQGENRTQRNTLALKDVAYVIKAEAVLPPESSKRTPGRPLGPDDALGENTVIKYVSMFNRRVEQGQCFHRPYLGIREFAAAFGPPEGSERPISDSRDLGRMLYDIAYSEHGNKAVFFNADGLFRDGVFTVSPERAIQDAALREEVLACSFKN